MPIRSRRAALAACATVTLLAASLVAAPAHAAQESANDANSSSSSRTIPVVVYDRYSTVNKVKTSNFTNKSQVLGDCLVIRAGATCVITRNTSATRTVGLALGATRSVVSSSLTISTATTESASVSCTSPKLAKNGRWRAWPRGDRFTYKVKRERVVSGAVASRSTSGPLTAFSPKKNTFTCG